MTTNTSIIMTKSNRLHFGDAPNVHIYKANTPAFLFNNDQYIYMTLFCDVSFNFHAAILLETERSANKLLVSGEE